MTHPRECDCPEHYDGERTFTGIGVAITITVVLIVAFIALRSL